MAASFRWSARRSGFCQLQPIPCRNRAHTPTVLYRTRNCLRMTSPMRLSVHNSVEYPAAPAPRSRTAFSCCCCVVDKRHGRPGVGRTRSPLRLSRRYACSHRTTELSDAPTRRAISRYGVPPCRSVIACRRRLSNCPAVPDGLIRTTVVEHSGNVCIISQRLNKLVVTLAQDREDRIVMKCCEINAHRLEVYRDPPVRHGPLRRARRSSDQVGTPSRMLNDDVVG